MKEKIEKLIQAYQTDIKNYDDCSCRGGCKCEETSKYLKSVYKKVIKDLEEIVRPSVCVCCEVSVNSANRTEFTSQNGYRLYICIDCINANKDFIYETK